MNCIWILLLLLFCGNNGCGTANSNSCNGCGNSCIEPRCNSCGNNNNGCGCNTSANNSSCGCGTANTGSSNNNDCGCNNRSFPLTSYPVLNNCD